MAEIIQNEGGKQKGKKRSKRHSTHIDMTPMVDLACLLLTFFMLTTAFAKAKVMEIVLPEKDDTETPKDKPEVDDSRALNIILIGDDKVLWYNGLADPARGKNPTINESDFSDDGIRKILLQRNKELFTKIETMNQDIVTGKIEMPRDSINAAKNRYKRADRKGPVVLIKAADNVKYKNVVDILDEMAITNIAVYALIDINDVEKQMVANYLAGNAGAASNK